MSTRKDGTLEGSMTEDRGTMLRGLAERLWPRPEGFCLLALSGGADSVALLHMLLPRVGKDGFSLEAVHVNHGLRGTESEADAAFARELCAEEGVPFHLYTPDLKGRRDENAAREARYACFRDCMCATGAKTLLLAHHADDQAETFLMRLLRGAGPEGLSCMEAKADVLGVKVLRPMLQLGRAEIREALRQAGHFWREDSSNAQTDYLRNAIRLQLLPEMDQLAPGVSKKLAQTARLIGLENEAMRGEADRFLQQWAGALWLDAEKVRKLPAALQARVLRRWWQQNGPVMAERGLNLKQTEAGLRLLETPGGISNWPGGWRLVRGKRWLHMVPPQRAVLPEILWRKGELAIGTLCLESLPSEGTPGDGKRTQELPVPFPEGCVLRGRRAGDRIRPFGGPGGKKLQDYLVDRGVDEPFRDQIPLLCRGNEVLWVAGVGAGDVPRWRKGEEHLRLVWQGEMPWMSDA